MTSGVAPPLVLTMPLTKATTDIIGQGNPLDREIRLLKYQWSELETLSVGHFADSEALFTYKLKLLLLVRLWSFDQQRGYDTFIQFTSTN